MQLEIDIINKTSFEVKKKRLTKLLKDVFLKFAPKKVAQVHVEIILTNNQEIKVLNKQYRNKDEVTDILSFPLTFDTRNGNLIPFFNNLHLGTIVISIEQASRQIGKFGKNLEQEIFGLAEHGFRHLLGNDHDDYGAWQS